MKKNKNQGRLIAHFFLNIVLLLITIMGSFFAFSKGYGYTVGILEEARLRKANPNIREVLLEVTPTTSFEEIADTLYDEKFIAYKDWFLFQGKLEDITQQLNPGTYSISSNMSNEEILSLLSSSKEEKEETVKFTIPEGFTITQIADRLDSEGIVPKEDFLRAVNEREYDFPFLKEAPRNTKYKLEGYLFPDTYIVRKGATAEEIIIQMLNQFEAITSQYSQYLYGSIYTLHDVVTIASIIEQEAKLDEERAIISGVIYNRLEANMKLQMCSTIQYVLEKRKANLSYDDLKVESPYNTYKYEGLPLGPISSPGEASLKAAFLPEENNFFFFVLKDSKTGAHAFGTTAAEHENNAIRYQQTVDKNFYE